MRFAVVGVIFAASVVGQNGTSSSLDPRLSIHTIIREDLFAGYLANDMDRFTRGERTLEELLAERPSNRAPLLAWKGANELYRAVRANEQTSPAEYRKHYAAARALFAEASRTDPANVGVAAVTGAACAIFGDRVLPEHRSEVWQESWTAYQVLWKLQSAQMANFPVHIKGELLAGIAQAAQRTGREAEMKQTLEQMIAVLKDSPYEARARAWIERPEIAARTNITCQTCHDAGRLEARKAALTK